MDNTVRPSHMPRLAGPQIIKKIERQSASAVDHIQKAALFEVPLIKTMRDVRFEFGQSTSDGAQIRDGLSPQWKRAIIDTCLVAVVYCFESGIALISDPDEKRAALSESLENYISRSQHSSHQKFQASVQRMRSIFGDQVTVFKNGILQDRTKGPIRDAAGNVIPQLLLISRLCFACEHCWGPQIRDVIATHFWEGELQNHLHFSAVEDAIDSAIKDQKIRVMTPLGTITHNVLREMEVVGRDRPGGPLRPRRAKLWVMTMTPAPGVSRASQALQHYLNEHNFGSGLILVKNSILGTSALFKGSSIPEDKWEKLVQLIKSKEDECWHVIHQSTGRIAPFIVNGNKAHQYVPRSGIDAATLVELAKRTLY